MMPVTPIFDADTIGHDTSLWRDHKHNKRVLVAKQLKFTTCLWLGCVDRNVLKRRGEL
jgi:hypothetical protein